MTNDKVYIHEFIDIIGHHRADYMHHMTANWSPIALRERNQKCYGVFGTVGTTRRWPEVVNIWEEEGFDGLARSFRHELGHATLQNPSLAAWWARAASFRRSGTDRVLAPAPWTATIDELCADGGVYETYAHEMVAVRPGSAWDYLEMVREHAAPVTARFGWRLLGAWVTTGRNDSEAVLHWGLPRWDDWAAFEKAQRDDDVMAWKQTAMTLAIDWERFLVVDAPLSPLRTHRQPLDSDRDSYKLPD